MVGSSRLETSWAPPASQQAEEEPAHTRTPHRPAHGAAQPAGQQCWGLQQQLSAAHCHLLPDPDPELPDTAACARPWPGRVEGWSGLKGQESGGSEGCAARAARITIWSMSTTT